MIKTSSRNVGSVILKIYQYFTFQVKGSFVTDRPEPTRGNNVTNCGYWIKENNKKTWLNWHAGLAKVDVASVMVICFKINVEDVVLSIVFLVPAENHSGRY